MAEQQASQATVDDVIDATMSLLTTGGNLGELKGFTDDEMNAVYTLAYNLYSQGQYEDAEKLFQFLCTNQFSESRNWIGLGAARQMQKDYEYAIQAYAYCFIIDIENPEPPLHAGECYLALGDLAQAESGFFAAVHWAGDNPKHAALKSRAETLLKQVQGRIAATAKKEK